MVTFMFSYCLSLNRHYISKQQLRNIMNSENVYQALFLRSILSYFHIVFPMLIFTC